MAADSDRDHQTFGVQDEGDVDATIKRRIIEARDRVDKEETYLYVKATVDDSLSATPVQQQVNYGLMVKQYLRWLEPILREGEIDTNEDYYEGINLGSVTLIPKNTDAIPFEDYVMSDIPPIKFKNKHGISTRSDLPEPRTTTFNGLKSVIETDGIVSEVWTVSMDDGSIVRTMNEQPVPKQIYENAFREANAFAKEAGLGIDVDPQPYMGEGGPGL